MRTDIDFTSAGTTCRGWLYRLDSTRPAPAIVMTHGFSAVKEQGLDAFARLFCARGFVVLVFDYRHLGASDGNRRGRVVPQEQHDDLRAALGWLAAQPFADPDRIGLWGTSYSGGHALFLGALDPRVKVVVAQAPAIALADSLCRLAGGRAAFAGVLALLAADHAQRNDGREGGDIAVTAPDNEPCVLPGPEAHAWFAKEAGSWRNRTSLESVARMAEYMPASLIDLLSPKPLLMIAARNDTLIAIDDVRAAFARAGEPKRLREYPCGHFGFYPGEEFHAEAARDAAEWFGAHLMP